MDFLATYIFDAHAPVSSNMAMRNLQLKWLFSIAMLGWGYLNIEWTFGGINFEEA